MESEASPEEKTLLEKAEEKLLYVTAETKQKITRKDLKDKATYLNTILFNKISGLLSLNKEQWEYYTDFCKRNGHDAKAIRNSHDLFELEKAIDKDFENLPKIAMDTLDRVLDYNSEILKRANQIKVIYLKRKIFYDDNPKLKKTYEFQLYKDIYLQVAAIANALLELNGYIRSFEIFRKLSLYFAELPFNREEISRFFSNITEIITEILGVDLEKLSYRKCAIIHRLNERIVLRLAYFNSAQQYQSYKILIEYLEVRSTAVFYKKVKSKYPDQNIKQIYANAAISKLKNEFVKNRLSFFHGHCEVILEKIADLNLKDATLHDLQVSFGKTSNTFMADGAQERRLNSLHQKQEEVFHQFHLEYDIVSDSKKISERSLQELFEDILKAYALFISRDLKPSSRYELIVGYLRSVKQTTPKYERVNSEDMAVIRNVMNERNVPLLKVYYNALNALIRGQERDDVIIDPIVDALLEKSPDKEIKSPSGIAYLQLSKAITPEDIVNLVYAIKYLPKDRERLTTSLGGFFMNLGNLLLQNLKKEIDYPSDIRPIGNKEKYVVALIEQKLIKLYYTALNEPIDEMTPLELLAGELEKENQFLQNVEVEEGIKANHLITSLILYWEAETDNAIQPLHTSSAEKKKYEIKNKFQQLTKPNLDLMIKYFTESHLKTLNKRCEALDVVHGRVFKGGVYPSFKEELLLLYVANEKILTLRGDEKEKHRALFRRIDLYQYDIADVYKKVP